MARYRERPLPNLSLSLESLPPPSNVMRDQRLMLRFSPEDFAKIEKAAKERGEQPSAFLRTVVLAAFENSALRALGQKPDLLEMSPAEQQKVVLEAFAFDTQGSSQPASPELLPPRPENRRRDVRAMLALTKAEARRDREGRQGTRGRARRLRTEPRPSCLPELGAACFGQETRHPRDVGDRAAEGTARSLRLRVALKPAARAHSLARRASLRAARSPRSAAQTPPTPSARRGG